MLVKTYADASWGNNEGWSTFYVDAQQMCNALISWRAYSGKRIHSSTRDAELHAAVPGVHAALARRQQLMELRLGPRGPVGPPLPGSQAAVLTMELFLDSTATLRNTESDIVHRRSRHQCIPIAVIRQAVREGLAAARYTKSKDMLADCLTKPLTTRVMDYLYPKAYGVLVVHK